MEKQMTGFFMKQNTGLKWVKSNLKISLKTFPKWFEFFNVQVRTNGIPT